MKVWTSLSTTETSARGGDHAKMCIISSEYQTAAAAAQKTSHECCTIAWKSPRLAHFQCSAIALAQVVQHSRQVKTQDRFFFTSSRRSAQSVLNVQTVQIVDSSLRRACLKVLTFFRIAHYSQVNKREEKRLYTEHKKRKKEKRRRYDFAFISEVICLTKRES